MALPLENWRSPFVKSGTFFPDHDPAEAVDLAIPRLQNRF